MKRFSTFLVLCLFILGCSGKNAIQGLVPCSGTVSMNGTPLAGASLDFAPIGEDGKVISGQRSGSGVSGTSGHFTISTADGSPGIAPGTYKVRVAKTIMEEPKNGSSSPVPKNTTGKYGTTDTTDLVVKIESGGNKGIKLELTNP